MDIMPAEQVTFNPISRCCGPICTAPQQEPGHEYHEGRTGKVLTLLAAAVVQSVPHYNRNQGMNITQQNW
jgi:hypothetical protein